MPHLVEQTTTINASAADVWNALTDFASYPSWNPFIVSAAGVAETGTKMVNRIANNGSTMTFKPVILAAEPERELRWIGRFLVRGLVDGEHSFHIEEIEPGKVRFTQRERFTGILVPLVKKTLDVSDGFAAMNSALKARVEA